MDEKRGSLEDQLRINQTAIIHLSVLCFKGIGVIGIRLVI